MVTEPGRLWRLLRPRSRARQARRGAALRPSGRLTCSSRPEVAPAVSQAVAMPAMVTMAERISRRGIDEPKSNSARRWGRPWRLRSTPWQDACVAQVLHEEANDDQRHGEDDDLHHDDLRVGLERGARSRVDLEGTWTHPRCGAVAPSPGGQPRSRPWPPRWPRAFRRSWSWGQRPGASSSGGPHVPTSKLLRPGSRPGILLPG